MSNLKIGEKIKAKRSERGLTQEELANMLGVTKAAVSKWENSESFPDITTLPQIAQLFHITMDELFDYNLENKPLEIVNQYHFGLSLDNDVDKRILDYGTVKECGIYKKDCNVNKRDSPGEENTEDIWEVRVHLISSEEKFPYILQKYIRPGVLVDGYSIRLVDGKLIYDEKPNKHYVCKEKVWEYNTGDTKYLRKMLKEQVDMGFIEEDDI